MEVEDKGELSFALDMRVQRDSLINSSVYCLCDNFSIPLSGYKVTGTRASPAPVDDLTEEDVPKDEVERKEAEKIPVRALIGRLWWLALTTRPDIYCSVHKCALWQNKPSGKLWKRACYILEYLNGTRGMGIVFKRPDNFISQRCIA